MAGLTEAVFGTNPRLREAVKRDIQSGKPKGTPTIFGVSREKLAGIEPSRQRSVKTVLPDPGDEAGKARSRRAAAKPRGTILSNARRRDTLG